MAPPRRRLQATVEETLTPPDTLEESQMIARVVKADGKNLYTVQLSSSETLLVELEARFRSTIWLKRGSFVLIDRKALADRANKLDGQIINVVRDEKRWRKESYWPAEFLRKNAAGQTDCKEGLSNAGQMPSSEEDSDD